MAAPYAPMSRVERSPATEAMLTTAPPCAPIHARCASWTKPRAATHVDVEDLAHGVEVGVDERPELRVHAGVVHQDREAAERRHRGVDGRGAGGGVARVAGHGEHPGRVAPRRSGGELGGRGGQLVSLRPVIVTAAPRPSSSAATARPIPRLAPVTSAARPASEVRSGMGVTVGELRGRRPVDGPGAARASR